MNKKTKSVIEDLFEMHLLNDGAEGFEREYQFEESSKRAFDFAWPSIMLAVEIEGGSWIGGRHSRGAGFAADCEKYNSASLAGWQVFRFTGDMVKDGRARRTTKLAIERRTE